MTRRPRRRSSRLGVELLEDRATPAVITVTNLTDSTAQGDGVSLREAILSANADQDFNPDVTASRTGTYGADAIVFAAGLTGTIRLQLSGGPLQVTDTLSIQGPGSAALTVAGVGPAAPSGVFAINTGAGKTVGVSGLTVTGGSNLSNLNGAGGGFQVFGALLLDDVVVTGNTAQKGGGIALFTGSLTLSNVIVENNTATDRGGGIAVDDAAPAGTQITTLGTAPVTIRNNVAAPGSIAGLGGGIYLGGAVLNGDGMVFVGNRAAQGGAIHTTRGRLILSDTTFDNNAVSAVDPSGPTPKGGAIYSLAGFGSIDRSTFANNAAAQGGAIYHETYEANSLLSVTRSTFSGNRQTRAGGQFGFEGGGAISINAAATAAGFVPVDLRELTVANNTSVGPGAGLLFQGSSGGGPAATLTNSLVATNTAGVDGPNPIPSDVQGPFADGGGNFVAPPGVNPGLGPLANNGGPTPTIALLPGSPALGAGTAKNLVGTTDQRGLPRPANGPIDAGAFQVQIPTGGADRFSVPTGRPLTVPAPGVLANDLPNDPVYPALAAVLLSPPAQGTLSLNSDGSFTYTSRPGFVGTVTFTYAASNGIRQSPAVTVPITVLSSIPPTANPDTFSLTGPGPLVVPAPGVLANDKLNDIFGPLTAVLATPPAAGQGTVTLNPDGSFTYTPAAGFAGTATFTYRAGDGVAVSTPATVGITVTLPPVVPPPPPPPVVKLFAVGSGAGPGSLPIVRVFNADGSPRFDLVAFEPSFQGGVRPAVADVTGDGIDDIIVGAGTGGAPRVVVFDGATGAQLRSFFAYDSSFRSGVHVAAGDVLGGDGVAEVVTGAGSSDGTGGGPHVVVFDGRTGATLRSFFAYADNFRGGVRVAVGDVGGAPRIVTVPGPSGRAEVRVFDPVTQAEVSRFLALDAAYRGGAFVTVVGGDVVLSPDSITDFQGSILEQLFPRLPDIDGLPTGIPASVANLIAPAALLAVRVPASGNGLPAVVQVVNPDPGFFGGLRISKGTFRGRAGLFAADGPGGGGRLRFFPVGQGIEPAALDTAAFGPGFPFSVYVGG